MHIYYCPNSGSCETVKMSELGTKVVTCNEMPKLEVNYQSEWWNIQGLILYGE